VVYEKYSGGAFRTLETKVGEWPVRIHTMEEIGGQYVRKFGFHQPTAVALWKSAAGDDLMPPPQGRRYLGAAIYFPHLSLDLPLFLPSLGFDDLRKFDFPEPVLTLKATAELQARKFDWFEIRSNNRFGNWEGDGDIPPMVKERFPDF
jgi:hypothetical protein